jgi:hypothetical protein
LERKKKSRFKSTADAGAVERIRKSSYTEGSKSKF